MEVPQPDLPDERLIYVVCDMQFPDASVWVYAGPRPIRRERVTLQRIGGAHDWMVEASQDGGLGFQAYTRWRLVISPDYAMNPPRWGHHLTVVLEPDTYAIVAEDEDHVVVQLA